jgi:hypothetical protein
MNGKGGKASKDRIRIVEEDSVSKEQVCRPVDLWFRRIPHSGRTDEQAGSSGFNGSAVVYALQCRMAHAKLLQVRDECAGLYARPNYMFDKQIWEAG